MAETSGVYEGTSNVSDAMKFKEKTFNGTFTTTASYVTELDINVRAFNGLKGLSIKNTDGAGDTMYYKVLGTYKEGDDWPASTNDEVEIAAETSLADGEVFKTLIAEPYTWIRVQVKNNSGVATGTIQFRGLSA